MTQKIRQAEKEDAKTPSQKYNPLFKISMLLSVLRCPHRSAEIVCSRSFVSDEALGFYPHQSSQRPLMHSPLNPPPHFHHSSIHDNYNHYEICAVLI